MLGVTSRTSERLPYLPQLDGLRGIAVLLVLLAHGSNTVDLPLLAPFWHGVELLRPGHVGVDLFFALSGFLITRLLLEERRREGGINLRRFYVRRTLRIFPIYYFAVLLVSFTWPTRPGVRFSLLAYAFNYYLPFHPWPYPLEHTWSLAVEEQFYLLWPMLLASLPLVALPLATRTIGPAFAVGVAILFAALLPPVLAGELIHTSLPTRMFSLMLGAALAVAEGEGRAAGWRQCMFGLLAGAVILLATVAGRAAHLVPPGGIYWCFAIVGYGFLATGILGVAAASDAPAPVIAALSWHPLRLVGRISYGLYLYHLPIFFFLGINQAALDGAGVSARRLLLGYAVSVAVAAASYLLIERPLLRSRDRITALLGGRRVRQAGGL